MKCTFPPSLNVFQAQGIPEWYMRADAALETEFCSSNMRGLLKYCKFYAGLSKSCFLMFRLNEGIFHFTFLICTAKKQTDISKPFPNIYFKHWYRNSVFLHMISDAICKLLVISLTFNERF